MAIILRNVSGSTGGDLAHELLAPGAIGSALVKSILITYSGDALDGSGNIQLFLQSSETGKTPETYYLLRHTTIPAGAAILLDETAMLQFDNAKFGLYVTVTANDSYTVIIKT